MKRNISLFTRSAILATYAALISQIAHAQSFNPNDLYVGFVDPHGTTDYLIDLGAANTIAGAGSVMDLSSEFSSTMFSSFLGGDNITNVSVGVVGGQSSFNPFLVDLYATAFRSGGAGDASLPGSDLSPFNHSQSVLDSAANDLSVVGFPAAGSGVLVNSGANNSWTKNVAPAFAAGTFYGDSGVNPMSTFDSSGVLHEDLWKATPNSAYTYLGYFTLDSGNSTLTFTPVPEPGILPVFFCGGALLLLSLGRHRAGINA
jgi:hypothetical protein